MAPPKEIVKALVYLYVYWDEATRSHKTSTVYATLPTIRNGLGLPMYEGAIYVDVEELQGGIYVPPPGSPVTNLKSVPKADAEH
jgi:hypothetical protein